MKSCTLLLLAVTLVVMVVDEVTGSCCHAHWHGIGRRCDDCTAATPCCGRRLCNIFCCSCTYGCRYGECRWKRSLSYLAINPAVIFSAIDVNGDSVVDKVEFDLRAKAVAWPANATKEISEEEFLTMEFEKMDKNGDGMISPGEFDEDLM